MSSEPNFTPPLPELKPVMEPTADERQWALLAHLSGLIASFLGGMSFLGPLIVWLIKKDQSAFVADQAKEALNFQIAVTIALVVSFAIGAATCVGFLLIPVVGIGSLVFAIIAAMEANKGVVYRYPYTIRLVT
ncbi:MAG: DUF4870 domain-containing protein [Pirellulaceae bacterium]|jgi:hypothetical protein|nr:DUF4870 domain-containing protein [Pirellulaceae bacterium]